MLDYYGRYSYPTRIFVKGYGYVGFETYCKDVLPNEWIPSWHVQSLNAGAFCVRMVGWYHTINPASPSGAYDVSSGTQCYIKGSAQTSTSRAIDDTYRYIMVNSSDKIFFAEYGQGTSGEISKRSGGKLLQYGSQALAKKGYLYNDILNYYYGGSVHSYGNIRILKYFG
ncbi:SpoIID/LytB domain-containing protein [[Clostridium] polysaccharolyticum]|uniref:Stage II sporulation protein n=1 Tax=[Clostridium] polysaccharolyticum TaxID=29364 RepID=A0A1I0DP14_9FIRM|nr:SpoIID/LytB domain-containing protein [[Clostridium] polysaccharolyticum]SET33449.1 Stage II sporulation protein [[Clostridium] polysaccharolyticum]